MFSDEMYDNWAALSVAFTKYNPTCEEERQAQAIERMLSLEGALLCFEFEYGEYHYHE